MPDKAVILLVEDQENDIILLRRALTKSRILNPIQAVRTGEQAIAYLSGAPPFENRSEFPLPSLVLLDINMPGMDGFEVLRWIRQDSPVPSLRVVILTSSNEMRDVNRAYQLGANSFLIKPIDFERFAEICQAISGYWLWLDHAPTTPSDTDFLRKLLITSVPDPSANTNTP